ncbi:MAG TPA: type II secretion system major pseudopilin GspG [Geminicoccaceae bacterium]|nr:type II secretion system major pseudopilin GspG [Geminicoccaceae bacterium]
MERSTDRCSPGRRGEAVARPAPPRQGGFTLIELLVVLVILGLLAALAGPRVINYLSGARADTARLQLQGFASALDLYRLDVGRYPTTQQGLAVLVQNPENLPGWRGPYLDSREVPKDPWGAAYVYRSPGEHGAYDLYSLGSDGAPGGQGDAADVTNWQR